MTHFHIKIILFSFTAFILSGCQKTYIVSKSQDVLFQMEYISNTSIYTHWGIFIDVNGNILTYSQPERWNFPSKDQIFTKNEVLANVSACRITGVKIPKEELQKYINYIDNIAASKVTLPKNHNSDAGTLSYYCYQYSESSSTYKRSVIRTEGQFTCENLNFYSKKVVSWINEFHGSVSM
jgi:hypothetical protein